MSELYTQKPSIKNWPICDRPREKLFKKGEHALSNSELLAILLRTGRKGESALDIARKVLDRFGTFRNMSDNDPALWRDIKGLGPAKIALIKSAIEIGRRFREDEIIENKNSVKSSKDVVDILMPRMRDFKKEIFKVVLLNAQNKVISIVEEVQGTVNQANPFIREIIHRALQNFAVSIICVHNHPSGNPEPSMEDKEFTQNLKRACQIMQINLTDHIIIGDNRYYSFSDNSQIL